MIFIDNKYTKWYNNIISNARTRNSIDGYVERHHVIPKCLGGSNKNENLVILSAREHFICHWLLTKMIGSKRHYYQLWNALSSMLYWHKTDSSRYKITSRKFELLKIQISKNKSNYFSGKNNSMFGKKHSEETKVKMSIAHIGLLLGKPGHKQSVETKEKRSIAQKGIPKPKVTCEYCNKIVGSHGNYTRWHGSKCKLNTQTTEECCE